MNERTTGSLTATGLVTLLMAMPAGAHHGFGRFDPSREIEVSGVLTGLDFVNPHSYVYFDAVGDDGEPMEMMCEMRAATVLRRSGWSPDLFVEGANIVVVGRPHRDDPGYCYAETLEIGGAPRLERYQQLDEVSSLIPTDRPYRLANGQPDLGGDWAQEQYLIAQPPSGRGNLVPKSMVEGIQSGEIDMADVPNAGWGARPVTFTAAGQAASDALRDLPPEENPRLSCGITSVLFDWVFDGPINRITQTDTTFTFEYGRGLTRTVYMYTATHLDGIAPSRAGHSIGRWDGDTLVVDTVGFEPGIIAGNVAHSGDLHVVERFTLDPETFALKREYIAEDPTFFTDRYAGEDIVRIADAQFAVDECEELAFEYRVDE